MCFKCRVEHRNAFHSNLLVWGWWKWQIWSGLHVRAANLAILRKTPSTNTPCYCSRSFCRSALGPPVVLPGGASPHLEASGLDMSLRLMIVFNLLHMISSSFTCIKATYIFARYFPIFAHLYVNLYPAHCSALMFCINQRQFLPLRLL